MSKEKRKYIDTFKDKMLNENKHNSVNGITIQRYQDLKYNYLLEKLLLVQIIKNNDISNEQDLINILSIYPEQIRRALQTEYHDYVKSPEKYFKNIPKRLSLF